MPSMIRPARAARIQAKFRDMEDTMAAVFWDVAWEAWVRDRPKGPGAKWDDGTSGERWRMAAAGAGRLTGQSGRSALGDGLIYQQDQYRLRCDVAAHLKPGMRLVIGERQFNIESFEDRAGSRQHGYAELTELFNQKLPGEEVS